MSSPPALFPDRRQAMLQRLAELAMQMAESLAAEPTVTPETAMQFARVAKVVRLTLALEAQLAGAMEAKAAAQAPITVPAWEKAGMSQEQYDYECREEERLNDADLLLDRLIDRDPREGLRDELRADREELVREVAEAEIFSGEAPLSEVIARLARDLGLDPDWHGLTSAEWSAIDTRTRAELKAGLLLGDDPPGWPAKKIIADIPPLYGEGGERKARDGWGSG
jgi:hypothetical protein